MKKGKVNMLSIKINFSFSCLSLFLLRQNLTM